MRSFDNEPENNSSDQSYFYRKEAEESSPQDFSYHEPQPIPVYAPPAQVPPRRKKRVGKAIALILVVVLLAGTVGGFMMSYEIIPGDGTTLFTVTRKDVADSSEERNSEQERLSNFPQKKSTETASQRDPANNPSLFIQEAPSTEPALMAKETGVLTIQEIAAKVTPSTVGVVSTVPSVYGSGTSTGTGIIMTADGYIITNNHVINGASSISITLMDGSTHEGELIGGDARSDLAVVKIDASGLVPAEFGDSEALRVGDLAVAIGNPLGLELMGTVTDGIISAINRDVVVEERKMTLIQTNAAINAGNSGGPLINAYGQVIGINTLKMQDYYTSIEGLGFAIPTNTAKEIIDELIAIGYIKGRPAIGISGRTVNEMYSKYYDLPQGMIVDYVSQSADAYKQGLQVNDIIVKAQGQEIKSTDELNEVKEKYAAGDTFAVTVYRDGKNIDIQFKLMDEAELDRQQRNSLIP